VEATGVEHTGLDLSRGRAEKGGKGMAKTGGSLGIRMRDYEQSKKQETRGNITSAAWV